MKNFLLSITLTLGLAFNSYADINGNGYYRVMNYGSSRWATLVDNYAAVDFFAGAADLHSLVLTNNKDEILSDPGSVVYLTNKSGYQYDIASQGVTLESLVNNTISIRANGKGENNQNVYMIYGTYKGATKYIGDANIMTYQELGKASINVSNAKFNKWYFIPMDVNSDNYFGAVPTVTTSNGLYTTLFTSFAYTPYSQGVSAYYIGRVGYGMAEMIEISGAVPPGSPVVIKCADKAVANNKLQIVEQQTTLPANALTGVYFNYSGSTNVNQVAYDANTMRILGVCKDGSLGFITSDIDFIPSNTAYLKVPAGSAPEIKCVSTAEYEKNLPDAPEYFSFGDNQYALYPQGEDNYTGNFEIPAPTDGSKDVKIQFHASSSTSTTESYIGAYGSDVNIKDGSSNLPFQYGSPYYWVLPNWGGGTLEVTINLQYQYIKFYSKIAGIDAVYSSDGNLVYDGSSVICDSISDISVYDSAGRLISKSQGISIDLSQLPKGVYIVTAKGKSIKIQR